MSYINGYNADVWIEQNHPENGLFRVYWKDIIKWNDGGATSSAKELASECLSSGSTNCTSN